MHIADVPYEADGQNMIGHLAFDDAQAGPRPAVLVSHEGPGLDQHAKGIAEKLAALGYVAFALDYNGSGAPLPMDQVTERLGALSTDPERMGRLALAGLDVLLAQAPADAPALRRGPELAAGHAAIVEPHGMTDDQLTVPRSIQRAAGGCAARSARTRCAAATRLRSAGSASP